jgi:hypothetical protein
MLERAHSGAQSGCATDDATSIEVFAERFWHTPLTLLACRDHNACTFAYQHWRVVARAAAKCHTQQAS